MPRKLKTGFTTGTSAAAATKAAVQTLVENKTPTEVQVMLLTGESITIPVHSNTVISDQTASCTVIKDAGDDPDITHGAEIGATVTLLNGRVETTQVEITGGEGVGVVTKPGLEVAPGEPAINPGPRKMIVQSVNEVLEKHRMAVSAKVKVFVPEGTRLSKKTLNARLGIVGGISILGTTGVVTPLSHNAYIATVDSAMSIAKAVGIDTLVLTTGRRSERFSQDLWPEFSEESFIQIGDFFKVSLETASQRNFDSVIMAVFFGKALKMAQGIPHTHAAASTLTLHRLADWTHQLTGDRSFAESVSMANTARDAFERIRDRCPNVIAEVGRRIVGSAKKFAGSNIHIRNVIFDYRGNVAFDSDIENMYLPQRHRV
jgi:cobalt-precorrin-5B (C1)-methyltransferase